MDIEVEKTRGRKPKYDRKWLVSKSAAVRAVKKIDKKARVSKADGADIRLAKLASDAAMGAIKCAFDKLPKYTSRSKKHKAGTLKVKTLKGKHMQSALKGCVPKF